MATLNVNQDVLFSSSLGEQNAPTTWNTLKWNLNVTSSRIRTKLVFGDGDIKCESRRFIFVKRTN